MALRLVSGEHLPERSLLKYGAAQSLSALFPHPHSPAIIQPNRRTKQSELRSWQIQRQETTHGARICCNCIRVVPRRSRLEPWSSRKSRQRRRRNSRIMEVGNRFRCINLIKVNLCLYLGAFMYAGGSAGTNSTERANREAFLKWGIIPRMLVNATHTSLEVRD